MIIEGAMYTVSDSVPNSFNFKQQIYVAEFPKLMFVYGGYSSRGILMLEYMFAVENKHMTTQFI